MACNTAPSTATLSALTTPDTSGAPTRGRGKPPIAIQPIWVSVVDAMRLTSIGRTTLYKRIADGTLRSTTVGKRRLISVASIQALGGEA